jgi:hypothetical protein
MRFGAVFGVAHVLYPQMYFSWVQAYSKYKKLLSSKAAPYPHRWKRLDIHTTHISSILELLLDI